MDFTQQTFVETARQQYPYRMVHTAECASAKRSKWGTPETFEKVAAGQGTDYSGQPDLHEQCIKGDLRTAVLQRGYAIKQARIAAEKRRNLLVELSILETAVALIHEEVGDLTDEEQGFHVERKSQLRNGKFRPRSGRFDPTAYVVGKAPALEEAYRS